MTICLSKLSRGAGERSNHTPSGVRLLYRGVQRGAIPPILAPQVLHLLLGYLGRNIFSVQNSRKFT